MKLITRAGELSNAEIDNLLTIVANPRQFKIPDWFLNRKKDYKDGKYSHVTSTALDMKLRYDLERLKKIRNHRGLRHYWGLRVRGQNTKTTGRRERLLVCKEEIKVNWRVPLGPGPDLEPTLLPRIAPCR